jgi:peroxiredoxin
MKRIIALIPVATVLVLAQAMGTALAAEPNQQSKPPAKAPAFELKNYDGKMVNLNDFKGKIIVLEWFNYECPFVQYHYQKASTMIDLAKKYEDKNVVWLAINSTKHLKTEQNKQFAEEHKVPYPILDDRAGKTGRAYGAKTTPHIFIINAAGNIAYEGAIDNAPLGKTPEGQEPVNYVDKALDELTAGKEATIKKTQSYGCSVKYAE